MASREGGRGLARTGQAGACLLHCWLHGCRPLLATITLYKALSVVRILEMVKNDAGVEVSRGLFLVVRGSAERVA